MATADWRGLLTHRARDAGLDLPPETIDELASHLDDLYEAARRDGAPDAEARSSARRALDESGLAVLERHAQRARAQPHVRQADDAAHAAIGRSPSMLYALRMAIRQFRQHPTFAFITVLVLGLGTGAAAAVYTIVDAVVLRPLPYRAPDRLVTLWDTNATKALAHERVSPVNFMDYRALPAFADAAAWWRPEMDIVDPGLDPVRVKAVETSANLFTVLGVRPELGPGFPDGGPFYQPSEPVAVISDRLWRARYSANPSIIGTQLRLNEMPYTIVGVMPARFTYPGDVDVWQRLRWDLTQHSRAAHFMETVARLQPRVDLAQAQAQVQALGQRLAADHASTNTGWNARLIPLLDDQLGYYRPALMVLFGAVGLLLMIGCLNVASLLLTRALSREREIAVRTALGASPRQLIIQLLAESFVLSLAGAAAGVLAAMVAIPLVIHTTPVHIPRLEETVVNFRVLGLALGVIVATTVFFGLVPAFVILKRQLTTDLRSGDRGSSRGARRVYHALVAGEVALACALLVSSVLLVRTVQRMTQVSTGVEADTTVTAGVQLNGMSYPKWEQVAEVHAALLERLRQQAGVEAAGAGCFRPIDLGWRMAFHIDGQPPPTRPEDAPQAQHESVTEGYFEAFGAHLAAGRWFSSRDTAATPGVVIVNETFARQFLPSGAIGTRLHTTAQAIGPLGSNLLAGQPFEVVGVVADVRNVAIGQPIEPAIYFAARQFPFRAMVIAVRGHDPARAVAAIKAALKDVAPNVPLGDAQTWGDHFRGLTAEPRLLMTTLVFFGGLAALLAAIGVYGLFSWSVALRRRELAIRLTLGARPASIGGLIVRQSALLVTIGLVAGWAIVQLSGRALTGVLFDVTAGDLTSTVAAAGLLLAAAMTACAIPALRAAGTDPAEALRGE
jgi:putative ABC transport system permease protein